SVAKRRLRSRAGLRDSCDVRPDHRSRAAAAADAHAGDRDLRAAIYSISWSASVSTVHGTVTPSSFAVRRLTTSSNVVGCSMGMSAGFAPRRILSTKSAARRHMLDQFTP